MITILRGTQEIKGTVKLIVTKEMYSTKKKDIMKYRKIMTMNSPWTHLYSATFWFPYK